jgi:hypothetical protein
MGAAAVLLCEPDAACKVLITMQITLVSQCGVRGTDWIAWCAILLLMVKRSAAAAAAAAAAAVVCAGERQAEAAASEKVNFS